MHRQTIISELQQCLPEQALARELRRDRWRVYPYESNAVSGHMLYAHHCGEAPDITLPLNVRGWHKIFLGLYGGHAVKVPSTPNRGVCARLTADPDFQQIGPADPKLPETRYSHLDMHEIFWKAADLTGQDIIFSAKGPRDKVIAFVRLVPMTEQEISQCRHDNRNRKLIANLNTYMGRNAYARDPIMYRTFGFDPEYYDVLPLLRDSDFHLVCQDVCWYDCGYYPTKVGTRWYSEEPADANSLGNWVERVHAAGLRIYSAMRLACFMLPFETGFNPERPPSKFFLDYPEFWQRDAKGTPTARLSLAYPQVREHLVNVWREQLHMYPFDGVHIMFNRCGPFVAYEDIAVDEYRRRYDADPRQLPLDDARWLDLTAEYITEFVREVANMLNETGDQQKRPLGLAIRVLNSPSNCRLNGLDVASWLKNIDLDYLIPHPTFTALNDGQTQILPQDVSDFSRLTANTSCSLCPDVYPRQMPAEEFRQKSTAYYGAGADGLAFWDTDSRFEIYPHWNTIAKLGHKDSIGDEMNKLTSWFRAIPLISFDGFSMDPLYSPRTSG